MPLALVMDATATFGVVGRTTVGVGETRALGPQVEGAGGATFREALDRWAERGKRERARMLLGSGWFV